MPRRYEIVAKASGPKRGELLLYGDVGPSDWGMIDEKSFADALKSLGDVAAIDLRINSAGGSAFSGIAMYNQLMRHPASVTVHVDGLAASIASVIAMAGESLVMGDGAQLMIHDASSLAWGNAAEMRRTADLLDSVSGDIAAIYARRSGRAVDDIRTLMQAETWFGAQEAVDAKLATAVAAGESVTASLTESEATRFKHPPKELLGVKAQHAASRIASMAARARQHGGQA